MTVKQPKAKKKKEKKNLSKTKVIPKDGK